jgi:membrane-associated phospholipid phosphatase
VRCSLLGASLLALTVASSGRAQQARPDTAATRPDTAATRPDTAVIPDRQLFHQSDLYVAGAFALGTVAMFPIDRYLASRARSQDLLTSSNVRGLADVARFMGGPAPMIIGPSMYVVGRFGGIPRMAELGLHGTEAVIVGATIAGAIKIVAGRARPHVSADTNPGDFRFWRGQKKDDYKAFPSGHATAAFSAAAAVVTETHEWWPHSTWYIAPIMYGGATAVGLSRMYHDQHWASDIVMGAAIGTFSGLKTVRFNHTHTGNRIDRWLLAASIVPTPNGTALAWSGTW